MSWGGRNGLPPEARRAIYEAGWSVLSLYQPPWLFPRDGRKLSLCPVPSDPWYVTLHNGASLISATRQISAQGATMAEAVANALSGAGTDVRAAMARLEAEIDNLIGAMRRE